MYQIDPHLEILSPNTTEPLFSHVSHSKNIDLLIICETDRNLKLFENVLLQSNYTFNIMISDIDDLHTIGDKKPILVLVCMELAKANNYRVFKYLLVKGLRSVIVGSYKQLENFSLDMQWKANDILVAPFTPQELDVVISNQIIPFNNSDFNGELSSNTKDVLDLIDQPILMFHKDRLIYKNRLFNEINSNMTNNIYDIFEYSSHDVLKEALASNSNTSTIKVKLFDDVKNVLDVKLMLKQNQSSKFTTIGFLVEEKEQGIELENDTIISRFPLKIAKKDVFSERETEVLQLSITGMSSREIAEILEISKRTVEKHRGCIVKKSNAKNYIEAVVLAIKKRII